VRCVQSLQDGDVYEARDRDGNHVALKVARGRNAKTRLDRETRALQHASGDIAPRLIECRSHGKKRYVAMEWLEGQAPTVIAEQLRAAGDVTRPERLRLAGGILEAYATLHRHGMLHGDVHPLNIIVDRNGLVRLLDFEHAVIPGEPLPRRTGMVAYFLEPEAAEVMLRGSQPPAASPRGEQFALAALLFELFTGKRYAEFQLEPERFLQQVCSASPRPFVDCGVSAWPDVEAILHRALAKSPDDRFDSISAFLDGFHRIGQAPKPARSHVSASQRRWLRQRLPDLHHGGALFQNARTEAPYSSLYHGLAGAAAMHLRLAELRGDAEHLAAADCWCAHAEYLTSRRDAYSSAEIRAAASRVSPSAILHGPLGVALTRAAVAHARCDDNEVARASRWFRRMASALPTNPDLTLGRSGIVLGAATLLRISSLPQKERQAVRRLGRRTLDSLVRWARAVGGPGTSRWPNLGMAHGWAGILYAMLIWSEADPASELCAAIPDWTDALAALGERSGKGMRWPWLQSERRRVRSYGYAPGWCNGSAGFVALWSASHRIMKRPADLRRLEEAAWDASHSDSGLWSLCCGMTGRAFALLTAARDTGDRRWITRARHLADRSIVVRQAHGATNSHLHSLFRGDAGLALLIAELEQPDKAVFPIMEHQ
jgi:serine/threonine-protein kinase